MSVKSVQRTYGISSLHVEKRIFGWLISEDIMDNVKIFVLLYG